MIDSSFNVGDLVHWEEVHSSGFILSHLVVDGRLLTAPRWLSSVFCPPVNRRERCNND